MPDKKDKEAIPVVVYDPAYDWLNFEPYTLEELKAELNEEIRQLDKEIEDWAEKEIDKLSAKYQGHKRQAAAIENTLNKDRQRHKNKKRRR